MYTVLKDNEIKDNISDLIRVADTNSILKGISRKIHLQLPFITDSTRTILSSQEVHITLKARLKQIIEVNVEYFICGNVKVFDFLIYILI